MELVPWVAKATLILAVAAGAALALRRASADLRHLVWRGVFAVLLLLPLTVQLAPRWTPVQVDPAAPVQTVITVLAGDPEPSPRHQPLEWVWTAGMGFLLLREALRLGRARWLVARSLAFGADSRVRLSHHVAVPAVFGIWRPVILLPADAWNWNEDRLSVVLAHERMHILRRDPAWIAVARVTAALWWPHPLVWFALHRLIQEAEQACDDGVLAAGTPATEYATHLVAMVRTISGGEVGHQGGLPMIRVSELERRLRALLNPGMNRRPAAGGALAGVLLAAVCVLAPLSSLRAPAQIARDAAVRGTVEDAEGRPMERAMVEVRQVGVADLAREVVLTDATGSFRLDGVPEGTYVVTVSKEGFSTVQLSMMKVSGTVAARLRVQMQPAGEIQRPPAPPPPPLALMSKMEPVASPRRISVGGAVQAMQLVSKVQPVYPAECKSAGIEGTVILRVVIDGEGAVKTVERVNKMVDDRLAAAAMEAVKQWKYRPTLLNGQPVEVMADIDVNFTLAEKSQGTEAAGAKMGRELGPGAEAKTFRIGGDVSAPTVIYKVEPEYSPQARAAGLQGTVLLAMEVDEDGTASNIRVIRSLGMGLDEQAVAALGEWRFRPAMHAGSPVRVTANVEINFRMGTDKPQ